MREHGVDAIFVHGFPRKKRPFYTYPVDSRITMGFDCLFRGLERLTQKVPGLANVKEACLFPRDRRRVRP